MTSKIDIKDWITDEVIFSHECEDNTIRKTVEEAVKQNIRLYYADLSYTDLSNASLFRANLNYINLDGAVLSNANLIRAELSNANLIRADLRHAYLINTKIDYPMNLPDGEFIAWKKVNGKYIIKLKILEDSKRSRATTDKCRCDKAFVLEIQNLDGSKSDLTEVVNERFGPCTYRVGEIVEADGWDENRFKECSHGIHFFLNREIALKYKY